MTAPPMTAAVCPPWCAGDCRDWAEGAEHHASAFADVQAVSHVDGPVTLSVSATRVDLPDQEPAPSVNLLIGPDGRISMDDLTLTPRAGAAARCGAAHGRRQRRAAAAARPRGGGPVSRGPARRMPRQLRRAFDKLTITQKQVVVLYGVDHQPAKVTARKLGMPAAAVRPIFTAACQAMAQSGGTR